MENSKLIINTIIKQFSSLNDKGIYFSLKIIEIILDKIDKEEILQVLQNIYSLENKEDNILKLSQFQIKEKSIGLSFLPNNALKWYDNILNIPITFLYILNNIFIIKNKKLKMKMYMILIKYTQI